MHLKFLSFIWRHRLFRHIDWAGPTCMVLSLLWGHILGGAFTHSECASSLCNSSRRRLVQHLIFVFFAAKSTKSLSHHAIKISWVLSCWITNRRHLFGRFPWIIRWYMIHVLLTLKRFPYRTFLGQHWRERNHSWWIYVVRIEELTSVHEWIYVRLLIGLREIKPVFHGWIKLHCVLVCLKSDRIRLKLGFVFFSDSHGFNQLILFLK